MRVPQALATSPLIDAIFEFRFRPKLAATGDLLPGLFFGRFEFPFQVSRLPAADFPAEMREKEPSLHYAALHRLESERFSVQVGDRVVTVSPAMPYPGWSVFREYIFTVLAVAQSIDAVSDVERISLRFINIVSTTSQRQMDSLSLDLRGPWGAVGDEGLQLRFEQERFGHRAIVQVAPHATATGKSVGERRGLAVDVDVLRHGGVKDFWSSQERFLEECHDALKDTFFSLLREATIQQMGPTYGPQGEETDV